MKKLFVVKDKFEVKGKGIALVGITENESLSLKKGDIAYIKQPSLPPIEVEVLGFELMRNTWSPHKKRSMCIQLSGAVGINNIELEAEIWGDV